MNPFFNFLKESLMLFLGVLSVLQLTLLPGLLIIRAFPARRSFIQQFAYVFMLSLLANYTVVFLLVAVGLYLRSVVLVLFAAEVALLIWLNRNRYTVKVAGWVGAIRKGFSNGLNSLADWGRKDFWSAFLYSLFGLVALFCIAWVLVVWVKNFDTVFQTWDSWASWDRWAVKWADNRFPGDTWEYPQLIPVSYSLAYKFIGTVAVKFFGKSIMPLFALFIVLMLFDLGKKYRSYGYMLGTGLALYSINLFLGKYIPEGYVDIPVACFSLMAIYTLLTAARQTNISEIKQTLLLGSLAAITAALTKQTGLYLLAFYPILAYWWILRKHRQIKASRALVWYVFLVLVLVVPWYVLMEYRIHYGGNVSNIQYVISDIYKGQTLPQRFVAAVHMLGWYAYLYAFLIISLFVLNNKFRQIVILLILPFSVLWAFFLSYEARNLAMAFPLVSMTTGVAVESWHQRFRSWFAHVRRVRAPAYGLVIAAFLALGLAAVVVREPAITEKQYSEQKKIFEPALNQRMYRFFSRVHGPQPVITSYPLGWLPGLEDTWILERFKDYAAYEQTLLNFPDVVLLLVPLDQAGPQILAEINARINSGLYEYIFVEGNYMLVRIPPR